MRLFFHFANLYTRPAQHLAFQKRYEDICAEWLGGLTVHTHRSVVEDRQLGAHLRQILAEITFKEAPAFLDFALAAARETNFDVQTLGGVRQYLARYKARQVADSAATR